MAPSNSNSNSNSNSIGYIQHIPNLPAENEGRRMLEQLAAEFGPIVERRGWRVLALTEMCCCGDGDAHCTTQHSNSNVRRRRKGPGRIMSHNVQGYNMARGDARTSLGIHVRLRRVKSHGLLPYSDVAGVMAHELAHIQIGAHSAEFYELVEEIATQHATFLVSGNVLGKDNFPMGNGNGKAYRLGGLSRRLDTVDVKKRAAMAAEKRVKSTQLLYGSYILGGETKVNNIKTNVTLSELTAFAAERRQRDSKWCHKVNEQEVIDLLGSSSEMIDGDVLICQPIENHDSIIVIDNNLPPSPQKRKAKQLDSSDNAHSLKLTIDDRSKKYDFIDLTDKSSDIISPNYKRGVLQPSQVANTNVCQHCNLQNKISLAFCQACNFLFRNQPQSCSIRSESKDWECGKCTYQNKGLHLSCDMCGSSKLPEEEQSPKHVPENTKTKQVERSLIEFNGFNIYGNASHKTSTMKHMT